jgi:protein gp37
VGANSKIPWTDHTFNPWWGCTRISPGCDNCYADALATRYGFKLWDGAPRRFFGNAYWSKPLVWDAEAAAAGVRQKVFCGSMCDVFDGTASAELDVPREQLWQLIDQTPHLDWLLLTKRPENVRTIAPRHWLTGWPQNVWAMTTVENQAVAKYRLEALAAMRAPVRGISFEPLLGPINFRWAPWCPMPFDRATGKTDHLDGFRLFNWAIIGCEKLPGNKPGRPCELAWVRELVAQAREACVAVFIKQLSLAGHVSTKPSEWPEDLRIQEFPAIYPAAYFAQT